jgi:hypothetical protein
LVRGFKLSKDKRFVEKLEEIVGLYLNVSGERESVYFWRLGMHFFFGGSSSP